MTAGDWPFSTAIVQTNLLQISNGEAFYSLQKYLFSKDNSILVMKDISFNYKYLPLFQPYNGRNILVV